MKEKFRRGRAKLENRIAPIETYESFAKLAADEVEHMATIDALADAPEPVSKRERVKKQPRYNSNGYQISTDRKGVKLPIPLPDWANPGVPTSKYTERGWAPEARLDAYIGEWERRNGRRITELALKRAVEKLRGESQ